MGVIWINCEANGVIGSHELPYGALWNYEEPQRATRSSLHFVAIGPKERYRDPLEAICVQTQFCMEPKGALGNIGSHIRSKGVNRSYMEPTGVI